MLKETEEGSDTLFNRLEENKARAIFVDTEPKVINSILKNPNLSPLIKPSNTFSTHDGRGNNWAFGYSKQDGLETLVLDALRREAETCDFYQGSFMLHSVGGGTGSGLGSRLAE